MNEPAGQVPEQFSAWKAPKPDVEARGRFLHSFDDIDSSMMPFIGGKGANLVRLKKAGLPVPDGYSVLTDVHDTFLTTGRVPDGLIEEIIRAKSRLGGKIAIRSSANCEDGT